MCYEISNIDQRIRVVLSGTIGVREATSIRQQLFPVIQKGFVGVAFHLGEVTEMDSSGLGLLLAVQRIATDFHASVSITGAHELLRERMIMAGIAL